MSLSTKSEDALLEVAKGIGASVIKLLDTKAEHQRIETVLLRNREDVNAAEAKAQRIDNGGTK
jgi:hypothetical protein